MFSFIAIILSSGVGDMKLSWAFYGFAMITSIICILSILRSGRKRLVYWGMSVATILMTILLVTSIILSKPTESSKMQIIAYITLLFVVIINGISLYLLTQKSKMIEIPIDAARKLNIINRDNELIESLTNINTINQQNFNSPSESFSSSSPSSSSSLSSLVPTEMIQPPSQQFQEPPPPQQFQPPPETSFPPPSQQFQPPSQQFNQPPSQQFNQPPSQQSQSPLQQFNQPPQQFIPPGPIST